MRRKLVLILAFCMIAISAICQKPSKEEFFRVCDSLKIHNKEVVWAQARLESGNFTSAHFKNRNNCLGIYDSKNHRYASFASWEDCVAAYKNKVQYRCPSENYTNDEYISWLIKIGYAQDPNYRSKIKKMM